MNANDETLTRLINGSVQFVIPVFQRDYSWTEDDCHQLWADVMAIASAGDKAKHFIGSIVYAPTEDSSAAFTRWILIDGQQRLTTVMLLLSALRDHLRDSDWKGDDPTPSRLDVNLLLNIAEPPPRMHKLRLRRHDDDTFRAIVDGGDPPAKLSTRVRDNYKIFRGLIAAEDPAVVYRGIGRLEIVDVRLDGGDDPQSIFESLNSTGVALSQSDLIRNFILMGLSLSDQDRLYNTYWYKLELLFRGHEKVLDNFARDYVALKTRSRKQGRADEVYRDFRRFYWSVRGSSNSADELLADMLRFARYYAAFRLGREAPEHLARPLRRLRRLIDVAAVPVMQLFDFHNRDNGLSSDEFVEALQLLESYVLRRAVCGHQTRGYWAIFAALAYGLEADGPLDSLKVGLTRQSDSNRFPHDREFQRQLRAQDLYGKFVCRVILERLENHGTRERTDTSDYSIEHIMPQNEDLHQEWRVMLGQDNWRTIHQQWLHRLGNLTLTAYNTEYSDHPFTVKKSCPGGFEQSSVRLNQFVREQDVWTEEQMKVRGRLLSQKAVDVWPDLNVDPELLERAKKAELRRRVRARSVDEVEMRDRARHLFGLVSERTRELDSRVVEIAEIKSVSYHAPDFFMEVLPRAYRLVLLLNAEVAEMDDEKGVAMDTRQWKYFRGSRYRGGVAVYVNTASDVDKAMPLVRQALVITAGL